MAKDSKKPGETIEPESLEQASDKTEPASASELPQADNLSVKEAPQPSPKRPPRLRNFFSFGNLYLVIFVLLVLISAGIVFAALRLSKGEQAKSPPPQSLTDKQLAELKGSTTVVGSSQQVLDIQSSAVFQGPVLMRSNLDVAGSLKIGGPLSVAAVNVGGISSFSRVQVNDTLSVAGSTTLQGPVTVQRNLAVAGSGSFSGTLSASQLNVTNLQLNGDLTINRHIALSGSIPSRTNGSALGSGGTASVSGSDAGGTVTINTGSGPPAGCFLTVNFVAAYKSQPSVIISPSSSSAAGLNYYVNRSTVNFSVCTTNAPAPSTTYTFDYFVLD